MTAMEAQPSVWPVWTFADRLRKARHLTGLDQKAFAGALHVEDEALRATVDGLPVPLYALKSRQRRRPT